MNTPIPPQLTFCILHYQNVLLFCMSKSQFIYSLVDRYELFLKFELLKMLQSTFLCICSRTHTHEFLSIPFLSVVRGRSSAG